MLLLAALALSLSPVMAGPVESAFPAAPAATVEAFAGLARSLSAVEAPAGLRRFQELDFQGGGAALVLGSLDLPPELADRAAAAARAVDAQAPDAAARLQALSRALDEARKRSYASADERGAALAAGDEAAEDAERDAALLALSRFYGRGLQLSRIEFIRRRQKLAQPHVASRSTERALARASAETTAAFADLSSQLDADALRRHPKLAPFAALDHSRPAASAVLGTLALEPGAAARVRGAAAALARGDHDAAGIPSLEAELSAARRAAYRHADERGADLAAAPLTGDVAQRAATLSALSRFYGRGLQLSHIKLQRRLAPPRVDAEPAPAVLPAASAPTAPAAPAAPREPGNTETLIMAILIVVGAAVAYYFFFSAIGEMLSHFEASTLLDAFDQ